MTRRRGASDLTVELADVPATAPETPAPEATPQPSRSQRSRGMPAAEPKESGAWWPSVDAAWARRAAGRGDSIPGPTAAADAAEVLGATKLSASPYRTLQRLLEASEELRARWRRNKNTVIRQ